MQIRLASSLPSLQLYWPRRVFRRKILLTHHVRNVVRNNQAQALGRLTANQAMSLDIILPLRNQAGLDQLLQEIYDPASPEYRHYLTVPEFTAQFGPTQADYDAVIEYAKLNGLTVTGGSRDGMDVQVKGPVSAVQNAFHVNIHTYQHPGENRTFYAPDREPTVNLPFNLWHISGLDNYSIPRPLFVKKSDYAKTHGIPRDQVVSHASTGSGPSASYLGSDMRAAYYGGTSLTGAGQNLGLLEFDGHRPRRFEHVLTRTSIRPTRCRSHCSRRTAPAPPASTPGRRPLR